MINLDFMIGRQSDTVVYLRNYVSYLKTMDVNRAYVIPILILVIGEVR